MSGEGEMGTTYDGYTVVVDVCLLVELLLDLSVLWLRPVKI